MSKTTLFLIAPALIAACGGGPGVQPWQYNDLRPMADTLAIVEPEEQRLPLFYEVASSSLFGGGGSGDGEAWNADPSDGVVNSTWFTHRNSVSPLSPDAVRRGPRRLEGPTDPLTVTSIKAEGVTPGFNAKDATGARWIIKFDPPDMPELASGAEVVTTNLVWAAGYNTPENYIYLLDPDALVLDDDLEMVLFDDLARPVVYSVTGEGDRRLTKALFLEQVLARYPRRSDGTIRALASRFLDGIPIGPFSYSGVRHDDPNDVIPHEHRRELRGLYSIAAWLNHTDVKGGNSLDMFVPAAQQPAGGTRIGYVKHLRQTLPDRLRVDARVGGGRSPHPSRRNREPVRSQHDGPATDVTRRAPSVVAEDPDTGDTACPRVLLARQLQRRRLATEPAQPRVQQSHPSRCLLGREDRDVVYRPAARRCGRRGPVLRSGRRPRAARCLASAA
jgi:hypothetical protein